MKPYIDSEITENSKIRVFNSEVDSGELHWHRDRETRLVEVIEGDGWFLQLDNELPVEMIKGGKYTIPEGIYHRTIKGTSDLKIKIAFINE
jgi:cupin superfamily acireductone dioxygenase involved in methionine salvage